MNKLSEDVQFEKIYKHIQEEDVEVFIDRAFGTGRRRTLKFTYNEKNYIAKIFDYEIDASLPGDSPWQHDENILQVLQNIPELISPKTYGFNTWQEGKNTVTLYVREYLDGEEFKSIDKSMIPAMANYLAQLHQYGITSNDPYMYNFIFIDGQPIIIDFGKASQQKLHSLKHHYFVARELFKLFRGTLDYQSDYIELFWRHYFEKRSGMSFYRRALLKLSIRVFYLRQLVRSKSKKRKYRV